MVHQGAAIRNQKKRHLSLPYSGVKGQDISAKRHRRIAVVTTGKGAGRARRRTGAPRPEPAPRSTLPVCLLPKLHDRGGAPNGWTRKGVDRESGLSRGRKKGKRWEERRQRKTGGGDRRVSTVGVKSDAFPSFLGGDSRAQRSKRV